MASPPPRSSNSREGNRPPETHPGRFPTTAELLADLSPYGKTRARPSEAPTTSRRTRDFLLIAGAGSVAIVAVIVKLTSSADAVSVMKLALTAVGLFCGLLWYIFYGVMSRY